MTDKEIITSRSNPLIKEFRALGQRKARLERGLFLVEGIHPVGAAVEADWNVESILYSPDLLTSDFAHDLIAASVKKDIHCQSVSADVFRSLAGKENPQGILASVHQRELHLGELSEFGALAAIIAPQDPGNLGTILRTLDAVGANGLVLLDGGVDLYHPKVVRASMGALFWVPVVRTTFDEFASWGKSSSFQLIGTSAHGEADLSTFNLINEKWILLLGNEQKGLSEDQIAACDDLIALPMHGRGTSLNLAVAAGVLLYGLMK